MSHYIQTFNSSGNAVFSPKNDEKQVSMPIPLGATSILYGTHAFPQDISTESDIDKYIEIREKGFGPAVACPPGGTSCSIMELQPGLNTPMRAQPTVGIFYVLEGNITLHLDGGESRKLKAGDSGVLRNGAHSWTNETPDGGWAKMIAFVQSIQA